MPTTLTQVEDTERGKMMLRVEGSLTYNDAILLEKISLGMRAKLNRNITLDLADLHFLDSESAPVIKRMESKHGFEIEGLQIFLQKIIEETER